MGNTGAARPAKDEDEMAEDLFFDELFSDTFEMAPEEEVDDDRLDELLLEALAVRVPVPERSRLRAINAAEAVLFYEDEMEEPPPSVRTRPTHRPTPPPPDSA